LLLDQKRKCSAVHYHRQIITLFRLDLFVVV